MAVGKNSGVQWSKSRVCLTLLLFLLLASGCASRQDGGAAAREPGSVFLADGTAVDESELRRMLAQADYVLVGERHTNPGDHAFQARVARLVGASPGRAVLGLEMLPHGRFAPQLAAFHAGTLDLDALPSALNWYRVWGFDFSLYRPIFAEARRAALPIYGLNISNELRAKVSRFGLEGLTPDERSGLPQRIIPPLPEQREKLARFFSVHKAMIAAARAKRERQTTAAPSGRPPYPAVSPVAASPAANHPMPGKPDLERFLLIQSLWDSTMAEQAVRLRKGGQQVLIFAGSGHVEYGFGIAHRLRQLEPQASILSLLPFAGAFPEPGAADLFYLSDRDAAPDSARTAASLWTPRKGGRDAP